MTSLKNYNVHIDNKKRITLRGAAFEYYHVTEFDNGCITLEPRILQVPKTISKKTLKAMDDAVENFKLGKVSEEIDLSDF